MSPADHSPKASAMTVAPMSSTTHAGALCKQTNNNEGTKELRNKRNTSGSGLANNNR